MILNTETFRKKNSPFQGHHIILKDILYQAIQSALFRATSLTSMILYHAIETASFKATKLAYNYYGLVLIYDIFYSPFTVRSTLAERK